MHSPIAYYLAPQEAHSTIASLGAGLVRLARDGSAPSRPPHVPGLLRARSSTSHRRSPHGASARACRPRAHADREAVVRRPRRPPSGRVRGSTGFYGVLRGSTGFSGFTGSTRFYRVLRGSTGFSVRTNPAEPCRTPQNPAERRRTRKNPARTSKNLPSTLHAVR